MNKIVNKLSYVLLFAGLAIFSYLLLISNANFSERTSLILSSFWAIIFFIVAFNTIGFTILHINAWINNKYTLYLTRKKRGVIVFIFMAILLLVLNYGLLVLAKLLGGAQNIFAFHNGGERILILVWMVELLIVSLLLVNMSIRNSMKLQKEAAELQQQNNLARYVALQNQLNPHFLFNSLNTLIAEIEYDPQNAVVFTRKLSDVYRYVLQCQTRIVVSLEEELSFINSYIFLHQVRLGNCIVFVNNVDEEYLDCKLPPLTLQLLAENVVKHNSITLNKPMRIELMIDNNCLIMQNVVSPKIDGKDRVVSGTGLKNLADRYMLITGKKIEIINDNRFFSVKIPLIYE